MKKWFLLLVLIIWVPVMANNVEAYIYPFDHGDRTVVKKMIKDWKQKIGNKKVIFVMEGFQSKEPFISSLGFELYNAEAIRGLLNWLLINHKGSIFGGDETSFDRELVWIMHKQNITCQNMQRFLYINAVRTKTMIETIEYYWLDTQELKDDYVIIGFMGSGHFQMRELKDSIINLVWLGPVKHDEYLKLYNEKCIIK